MSLAAGLGLILIGLGSACMATVQAWDGGAGLLLLGTSVFLAGYLGEEATR